MIHHLGRVLKLPPARDAERPSRLIAVVSEFWERKEVTKAASMGMSVSGHLGPLNGGKIWGPQESRRVSGEKGGRVLEKVKDSGRSKSRKDRGLGKSRPWKGQGH